MRQCECGNEGDGLENTLGRGRAGGRTGDGDRWGQAGTGEGQAGDRQGRGVSPSGAGRPTAPYLPAAGSAGPPAIIPAGMPLPGACFAPAEPQLLSFGRPQAPELPLCAEMPPATPAGVYPAPPPALCVPSELALTLG